MAMPTLLVLVRHGQSESNELNRAEEGKRPMPENATELRQTPDSRFLLTAQGISQAEAARRWLEEEYGGATAFDARFCSNFFRTRQTAAYLSGPESPATWLPDGRLIERYWGIYGAIPKKEREKAFPTTTFFHEVAPWETRLENGESFQDVVDRWRDFQGTLHREHEGQKVLIVAHGEFLNAVLASIERMLPEEWETFYKERKHRIRNCCILIYSRVNPHTGELLPNISWRRMIYPDNIHESPDGGAWVKLPGKRTFTPAELLQQVANHI